MIYGHNKNLEFFERLIERDELSHAYAFVGMSGIGKSTFARFLSDKIADKICKNEQSKTIFHHRDLLHLQKEDNKILLEQINKLEEFFVVKSNFGKKIAIIDDFDVISEQMQNKLLKLLEEPPENALFFLIIENKYRVLPTILSRLSLVNFNPLKLEDMKKMIANTGKKCDNEVLERSFGSMNYYNKWFESEFREDVEKIFKIYEDAVSFSKLQTEEFSKMMKKQSEYAIYILDLLIKEEHKRIYEYENDHQDARRIKNAIARINAINECKKGVFYSQNENLIYDRFLFDIVRRNYDTCGGCQT